MAATAKKAAKASIKKAATTGAKKATSAVAARAGVKTVAKAATKTVAKKVATTALKSIARSIPGVGTVMGLGEGLAGIVSAVKGGKAVSAAGGGYDGPRRKAPKGITGAELRGYRKVSSLLRKEGLKPKRVHQAPPKRR